MDDPLLVRRLERLRNLFRDRERLIDRDRTAHNPLREILAVDELHHESRDAVELFEPVDASDVRMVHRREHFRFALKPREPIEVGGEQGRQNLDRDLAFQLGVGGPIHLPHPAFADLFGDFVDAETSSGSERHGSGIIRPQRVAAAVSRHFHRPAVR